MIKNVSLLDYRYLRINTIFKYTIYILHIIKKYIKKCKKNT